MVPLDMTFDRTSSLSSLLGFLFLGTWTICIFFPLAFAFLIPLLGLAGTAIFYKIEGRIPHIDHGLMLSALVISGLLIASSLWSITPSASLDRAFKTTLLLILSCPLLYLCKELPQQSILCFKKWAALPLIISALILVVEMRFSYPLHRLIGEENITSSAAKYDLSRHIATLILLTPFGIIFSLRSKFLTLPILLVILSGLVLFTTEALAPQFAMIVMMLAMPALLLMPSAAPILVFSGAAFLIAFMPWISPVAFDTLADPLAQKGAVISHAANISMRLENWDFLARRIMENPWTGFGVDTTRAMTFETEQRYFHGNTLSHPHNLGLQLWIEFGISGVILFGSILVCLYRRLKSLSLASQILPFTMFGGIIVYLLTSWSIWAGWMDGLILWVLGLLFLATRPKGDQATS